MERTLKSSKPTFEIESETDGESSGILLACHHVRLFEYRVSSCTTISTASMAHGFARWGFHIIY